jgi:hypothetical protein
MPTTSGRRIVATVRCQIGGTERRDEFKHVPWNPPIEKAAIPRRRVRVRARDRTSGRLGVLAPEREREVKGALGQALGWPELYALV